MAGVTDAGGSAISMGGKAAAGSKLTGKRFGVQTTVPFSQNTHRE
jgi:hypothetical protein